MSGPTDVVISDVATDLNGRVISQTSRTVLTGVLAKTESGSGGSSSASGCRTVTLDNRKYSITGIDHMYTYTTTTHWCWNRSSKTVSSVTRDWDFYIDNDTVYWRGQVDLDADFYAWSSGYSRSGYIHARKGEFENCIFKYGCTGTSYPKNIIRSHSDGTWTWWTDD
jgi:hypothetical protein